MREKENIENGGKINDHCLESERRNPKTLFALFGVAMIPIQIFEQHFRRLVEPDLSIQTRIDMLVEVRDSLEITDTPEYLNFLKCCLRASSVILLQITKPQFTHNLEHKLRNIVLKILNLLPISEVLRPFVQDLLKVAIQVLTTDNEENGLICTHIIFKLLARVRVSLENEVQPYLDFVWYIYHNFRLTASHFLENVEMEEISTPSDQLNPTTRSLIIITEGPLVEALMMLFLLHSTLVHTNIPDLLPLMVAALSIHVPEKVSSHMKPQVIALKGAQIKTVLFLTYSLKTYAAEYIRPLKEIIYKSIVNLFVTCSDSVPITKMQSLLVSLKYVLKTDLSSRFETTEMIKILVEDSLRDKKKGMENQEELSRVKMECESLGYSEARLVAKSTKLEGEKTQLEGEKTKLEGEKTQKEVEIQKLMQEKVKLTALLDKKEAQLLALNEQCKIMALNASNV